MAKVFEGNFKGEGLKIGVVVSRFNEFITSKLYEGCIDGLMRHGVRVEDIDTAYVPGSFEIPVTAEKLAKSNKYNAIICLGAVIRGATPHFEYVAAEASKGVAKVGLDYEIPVIFGILTCDTTEQAIERSGIKSGNKGFDAAMSAIEMANLFRNINRENKTNIEDIYYYE